MKKNVNRLIITSTSLIVIAVILSLFIGRFYRNKRDYANITSSEEFLERQIIIDSIITKDEAERALDEEKPSSDYYIVQATGKVKINTVIMQQAKIIQVLKGDKKLLNKNVWIYDEGPSQIKEAEDLYVDLSNVDVSTQYLIRQNNNFMKKDDKYLVFAGKLSIDDYLDENIIVLDENMESSYFNLSNDVTNIINDSNKLCDNKDTEFFCQDKETVDIMKKYKKKICDEYVPN